MGLGLSLCLLAFRDYLPADQMPGYVVAALSFVLVLVMMNNKHLPAALVVIAVGVVYAFLFKIDFAVFRSAFGLNLPQAHLPDIEHVVQGFLLLALPQIPLSLGNSVLASKQVLQDLFPSRTDFTIRKIGLTYSSMNLVAPFISGIPVCHGAGGIAGHYAFGGRTGGSVVIYGLMYLILGLFFGNGFHEVILMFPLPVLGVILIFEALALMLLVRDVALVRKEFFIALTVAIMAVGLPYGFLIGITVGTILHYLPLPLQVWGSTDATIGSGRTRRSD